MYSICPGIQDFEGVWQQGLGSQGYVPMSRGGCGVSGKSSTSRKKVSQTFSLRAICSYFLLGIKQASSGFSELAMPTVELLVLLNVTPRQLLCCVLACIGYHWILDGGDLRSWERREKGKGRWNHFPDQFVSFPPSPHQVPGRMGPSKTRFPSTSRVSCPIWVSQLFFYPLSCPFLC